VAKRKRYKLTWLKSSHRWRKRYEGKTYYFPARPGEGKVSSYPRCLAEWEERKARIDGAPPDTPSRHKWQELIDYLELWRAEGGPNRAGFKGIGRELLAEDVKLAEKRLAGNYAFVGEPVTDGLKPLPAEPWEEPQEPEEETPATVGQQAAAFLVEKRAKVERRTLSVGRLDTLRRGVEHFRNWIGGETLAKSINGKTLIGYHAELEGMIAAGKSQSYVKDYREVARQFIKRLYQTEVLDALPRNWDDPALVISAETQEVEVFSVEEVKQLLEAASERTRLYLLLMLNCGYGQKDISDLHPRQVDWRRGRIRRKRSKTANHKKVPIVDYPLWQETFSLLVKYRSADKQRVLLTEKGQPLKPEGLVDGEYKKCDNIRSAYLRVVRKLKIENPKPLKRIRKTSASLLAEDGGEGLADLFLGHAPRTIAQKHYIRPSAAKFDAAVKWLGEQFGC